MKKFWLFTFLVLGAASCIDSDYDLSNIDSDDIAIGSSDSEFVMPVVTIRVSANQLNQNSDQSMVSITDLYHEADIWLPTTLPGNAEYVEIDRMSEDADYLSSVLGALFDEMDASAEKRTAVCELVASNYKTAFVDFLPAEVPAQIRQEIEAASPKEAAALIADLYGSLRNEVSIAISQIATTYLSEMQLEPVSYEVSGLDLSSDVRNMLIDNLDPSDVENPVNALYLSGTIESEFPFQFRLYPHLEHTRLDFGEIVVASGKISELQEVRFYADDFDQLNEGSVLTMPVTVERYYPKMGLQPSQIVRIHLSLRKTGALQL